MRFDCYDLDPIMLKSEKYIKDKKELDSLQEKRFRMMERHRNESKFIDKEINDLESKMSTYKYQKFYNTTKIMNKFIIDRCPDRCPEIDVNINQKSKDFDLTDTNEKSLWMFYC